MDSITPKKLISNLFLLIFIVLFINVYTGIFDDDNNRVAVTVITSILMFIGVDIGYKPKESIFITIFIFIFTCFVTEITRESNIFITFIISSIYIFFIMYITLQQKIEYKSYLPFMLLYVFLDAYPVEDSYLPRIFSCIVGGILVTFVMYITTKKMNTQSSFSIKDLLKEKVDIHSERFIFSLKMAIGVSISIIIGRMLNVEKMTWISVVTLSITQSDFFDSKLRIRQRFIATLLGISVFLFLFEVLKLGNYLPIVSLVLGYIYTFLKDYDKKMIFVAINDLISTMPIYSTTFSIITRLILFGLGIIVAYFVSKVVEKKYKIN